MGLKGLWFWAVIGLFAWYLGYHESIFYSPQSIHAWRQADCASVSLNYYQHDLPFSQPQVHNYSSLNGSSPKCATSEMPLLYYTTAQLYKIFGAKEWLLRLLNMSLFFTGLFFLFRLSYRILKDEFWSLFIALFLLSSPVIAYYGNNYLSNISALGMALAGVHFSYLFFANNTSKHLYFSAIIIGLAVSFKITALISFAAFGFAVLTFGRKWVSQAMFWRWAVIVLAFLTPAFAWIFYAQSYNKAYDAAYFSTGSFPIWKYSIPQIIDDISNIYLNWFLDYFSWPAQLFLVVVLVLSLIIKSRFTRFWQIFVLFSFSMMISYIALQWATFENHDYYTINLFIFPVMLLIYFFKLVKTNFGRFFNSILLKCLASIFLFFNLHYASAKLQNRYQMANKVDDLHALRKTMRANNIGVNDKIIYFYDESNVSLYLLNQPGWTQFVQAYSDGRAPMQYTNDADAINRCIANGAKYIVLDNPLLLYQFPYLVPFCKYKLLEENGFLVFDTQIETVNFHMPQLTLKDSVLCNAELSTNEQLIATNATVYSGFELRSKRAAKFGAYGLIIPPSGFAFTQAIKLLKGEKLIISAWIKGENTIIVGQSQRHYYSQNQVIEGSEEAGWHLKQLEFSGSSSDSLFSIYLYNTSKDSVFADEFKLEKWGW